MELKVYSIFDDAVKAFRTPMFLREHGEAVRVLTMIVNDKRSENIYESPQDFALFYLGTFDDKTGVFISLKMPENLGLASAFKKSGNVEELPLQQ